MKRLAKKMRTTAVATLAALALGAGSGCDEYGLGMMGMLGGGGWNLFDPTSMIQDAWQYRMDVMDNTMNAWDQYITGDYYGGDNDDPSTPTFYPGGEEWP
ncbi:hypothetical protein RAS1_06670 [Phycisphaerae bacterium RAS1]|nr:hypothetical protein RAS1_06670 [Phycisphaerae bacterium RAS1]